MKKFFLGLIALLISATLFAAPRTVEEAASIAASFSNEQPQLSRIHKAPRKAATVRLAHKVAKPNSTEDAFYVFNQENGFVIVSADDNAPTILGYSDESTFDASNIPSNVQYWFDYTAERVAAASKATTKVKKARRATQVAAIAPLLGNIKWDQGTPYNNLCPMDKTTRAYTGCVATAAAQIMKMYNWPETGQGSHTDNWTSDAGKSGTSSANFGETTYDWANMLDSYKGSYTDAQAKAVATLMFHVGVSCDMQFGGDESNGSGAYTNDMGTALVSYFRYKNTLKYKSGQSTSQLTSLFNTELEAGRPILMGGSTTSNEGHEFVCDGRDADGYFHINWGWGGSSNGYFALAALDPDQQGAGGAASGKGFSKDIDCVIGIEPDKAAVNVTSVSVSPTAITLKIKESQQLTATVAPADASNKAVTWSSSDESIAKVSASGIVVGVAAGNATITVKTNDGNKTSSCAVTVSDEIAEATLLNVDRGVAEYDDQYEEPWTIHVWNSNTTGNIPYIMFYPDGTATNAIAGTYTLGSNGGALWNDPNDTENSYVKITGGQLVITCTAKGTNGCNTYRILSYFTCEDGVEYKVDATMELCAEDADDNAIELSGDNAGDGAAYEITWLAKGETFAANIAIDGKITLPADKPGKCENDKVFVGWCKDENYDSDVAPSFAKTGDAVTANTNFYAVYATASGSTSSATVASVTFKQASSDGTQELSDISSEVSSATGIASYDGSKVYKGKNGVKLGTGSVKGYVTLTLASTVTVTKVNVSASQYSSDNGKITVTAGSTTIGSDQSPAANLEFTASSPVETNTITVGTTSKRAYISSISIVGNTTSYEGYTTSCGAPAPKYAITVNPTTNGTLASNYAERAAGKTVTITATPNAHYHLATLTVKDASDADVAVSGTGNTRTFTMPEKAVTVSGTFEQDEQVTVRFFDKGSEISSNNYFPGEVAEKPADPTADCAAYTFVGWWTATLAADNQEAKTWVTNFTVTGAQDYYAIYSKTEQSQGAPVATEYTKVSASSELTDGQYLIVCEDKAVAFDGGLETLDAVANTIAVSVVEEKITITDETKAAEFTIAKGTDGKFTVKSASNKYIGHGSDANGLTASDTEIKNTISISEGDDANIIGAGGAYLRYNSASNQTRFRYYKSSSYTNQTAIQLYKAAAGGAPSTTYYSSVVDCATVDIDNTVVAPKAIKVIENGQIIIILGNDKYTIFGQKIQ